MAYKINPVVDEAEYDRHHNQERFYADMLRERGLLLELDNILVDAEQLVLRTFQCNTNYCVRCTGSGKGKTFRGSCCTDLQVDVTVKEKQKLFQLAKMAEAKLTLGPKDPLRRVVDDILADRIIELNDEHELVLEHKKNEACIMSWMDGSTLRCSINSLCTELDLDLTEYKPDPCFLFPLHYGQVGANDFLLSVLCTETRDWIGQHAIVGKLACLRKPEPGSPPAYEFLRGEIEYVFGKRFYRDLDMAARPILKEYCMNGTGV